MSAQLVLFVAVINCIIFPFALFNFLILKIPFFDFAKPFVVTTGSMDPVVPAGSIIYAFKKPEYKIGEVITFSVNEEFVTHRIVKELFVGKEKYFVTKGDMNKYQDHDLIHESNISGRIDAIVPLVGQAILQYKTPAGLFVGTLVPFFFLLLLAKLDIVNLLLLKTRKL